MSDVYIPYELVLDVLSRLPVKTLKRFKCVSKSWYGTIDNPDFIKAHVKHSKSSMKLIAQTCITGWHKFYEVNFSLGKISNLKEIKYPGIINRYEDITIAGSCDGLVCVVCSNSSIVLWNPSTREHLGLPFCAEYKDYCVHGLGYDESTDDYKVVRLEPIYEANVDTYFYRIYIYSIKSNEWRRLEDFAYNVELKWRHIVSGVNANGALHWLLEDNCILALNLGTESFQVLPPPPEYSIETHFLSVAILNGCQHLIFDNLGARVKWIRKDYGSKDPWTKFTLNFSPATQFFIVMPMIGQSYIKTYNLENRSCKNVEFTVEGIKRQPSCLYFESLVPLSKKINQNLGHDL